MQWTCDKEKSHQPLLHFDEGKDPWQEKDQALSLKRNIFFSLSLAIYVVMVRT
jgi:hypothetical protein